MRYLLLVIILSLIAGSAYAQYDDSTQVTIPTPPENIDVNKPEANNENPSQLNLWLDNHNKDLLTILNKLAYSIYDTVRAQVLMKKISEPKSSSQETAEYRTKAINDFLDYYIRHSNRRPSE